MSSTSAPWSLGRVAGWLVGAAVGFLGVGAIFNSSSLPKDLLTRPWVSTKLGTDGYTIDAPWKLESQPVPFNSALIGRLRDPAVCYAHTEDGGGIMAFRFPVSRDTEIDLDGAATGMVEGLNKTQGVVKVEKQQKETTLLGERAIEVTCRLVRDKGKALRALSVVALANGDLMMISVMSFDGDPVTDDLFRRVRASIRE